MSKDRFRGYTFQQFNHQRLSLCVVGMPSVEKGVLLDLKVLFGLTRQQFGWNDGRLSLSGQPVKVDELAKWLAMRTPGLSVQRAEKALLSLYKEYKQIGISRAKIVKMGPLAMEQKDAPTDAAARKRRSREGRQMDQALLSLYKANGQVLEPDVVLYRVQAAANVGAKVAERLLKALIADGVLVPADGGLLVAVSPESVPAASPLSPPVSDGPDGRDGEATCARSDERDMSQSQYHMRSQKRDSKESHDHDARTQARPMKESPERAGARPGPGLRDAFGDEGGGERRSRGQEVPAPGGIDAIYQCHHRNLPQTAVRLLGASEPKKSISILSNKLRALCDHGGPDAGQDEFRMLVQAVHTEMCCPGGQRLREPCMELCARINEAMGMPRRGNRKTAVRS